MRAVFSPSCVEELLALATAHPGALLLAGGTDLLVRLRAAQHPDDRPLLSLARVAGLRGIADEGAYLSIGAATTFAQIIADPLIREHAPLLAEAAGTVGGPAIRNMATIGGNIRTASPAGDSLPPLYLLAAEVELASREGTRRLPIAELITGPGRTALRDGEIISRVCLPRAGPPTHRAWEKVGRRRSLAIAVTSFAGMAWLSPDGALEEARFAWGSVAPTVVRIPALERGLCGSRLEARRIDEAAAIVRGAVSPIDDIRASAGYRRAVAGSLLVRFLEGIREKRATG